MFFSSPFNMLRIHMSLGNTQLNRHEKEKNLNKRRSTRVSRQVKRKRIFTFFFSRYTSLLSYRKCDKLKRRMKKRMEVDAE